MEMLNRRAALASNARGRMLGAAVLAVAMVGLAACAGVSGSAATYLTPRNAYIAEGGVKAALATGEAVALSGRLSASRAHAGVGYVTTARPIVGALRYAFDHGDLIGAGVQLVALAGPIAQTQALAYPAPAAAPSTAGDAAAALKLLASLAQTYGETRAVLAGDPAALPAAVTTMRGEVDLQFDATLAALHAASLRPLGG